MYKAIAVILILAMLAGCATLTQINTEPLDAQVWINQEPVGKSPVVWKLSDFILNRYQVMIKKDGYETFTTVLRKEFKVGAFVGGVFTSGIMWLWVAGPKDYYFFELVPKT